MKVGQLVIPKDYPALKSKISKIELHAGWDGKTLYTLENNTIWTKNELK